VATAPALHPSLAAPWQRRLYRDMLSVVISASETQEIELNLALSYAWIQLYPFFFKSNCSHRQILWCI